MNELTKDPNAIEARIALDLPGMADAGAMPNDIQWAPPGSHSIHASRGGKPVELDVNVTPAGAQRVAEMHARYTAAADSGEGDRAYFDFNHDDKEASAHPKGFFWGGDDPQKGGIRANLDWTGAGKRAVLGRDFRRFSPSFYVDGKGEIRGMPVNCGGLVNRAAFQRIAPIMSKLAEANALTSAPDFLSKAKVLARSRNLSDWDSYQVLAHAEPYLYDCYRWEVLGLGGRKPESPQETTYLARWQLAEHDEFVTQAKALSDALDLTLDAAANQLARSQPALYERYRDKLGLGDSRHYNERVLAVHARAEASPFFLLAKSIATQRKIDITAAFGIAARQSPELYDSYRQSL
ncbi:MAG: hypothetical protein H0X40_02955 [Chthoniobacterales bacterium]|nr:hypothetical protein [Chthoniobacterales bacterium]